MARRGLTLIELLVVVAIVALLLGLSMPALVRVRNQAQGAVCIQNLKTLSLAWLLYKKKEGVRQGALFGYVGDMADVYRCPADTRKLGPGEIAFRSYSIAGGANGEGWQDAYIQAEKYSQILQPATKYVFVEEADPRGWNKGSWVLNPRDNTWVDPLAIWHSRARSSMGYADGHAEIRQWVDTSTMEMSRNQEFFQPIPTGEGQDQAYMLSGFPQRFGDAP